MTTLLCRKQDLTKQWRENRQDRTVTGPNSPDDLGFCCRSTMWAPLMMLGKDQITGLWKHSNLASNGRRIIQFCWVSKLLDGLDENNIKKLENLEHEKRANLEVLKNPEKIANNPRNIRRPCLCGFWKLIWWSGVGHQDDGTVADVDAAGIPWTYAWICFLHKREIYSSLSYCLDALEEKKLDILEPRFDTMTNTWQNLKNINWDCIHLSVLLRLEILLNILPLHTLIKALI